MLATLIFAIALTALDIALIIRIVKRRQSETIYEIVVLHRRPKFGNDVTFLETYHAKDKEGKEERLREVLTKSFQQAHPTWPIIKVTVTSNE